MTSRTDRQPNRAPVVDPPGRLLILAAAALAAAITVAYWVLWYVARSSVASNHRAAYYEFENAFPLADGWLVLCLLASVVTLSRRSAQALLWLLAAGGAAIYLCCLDVLYDVEQRVWWRSGAGGWLELVINVLTLVLGVLLLGWGWRQRGRLLGSRSGSGAAEAVQLQGE